MTVHNLIVGATLLALLGAYPLYPQSGVKLSLDATKPFVYIEFDHAGSRQPIETGEPTRGFWLRLVNNSVIPIEVEAIDTDTNPKIMLLPDIVAPRTIRIPKSGAATEKMPVGYASGLGSPLMIASGKDFIFSVPANHVAPSWYMQVPFRFSLPSVKEGVQPVCYAEFKWEDLPEAYRVVSKTSPADSRGVSPNTLLHESGHVDASSGH
jgi:hypothetical protein